MLIKEFYQRGAETRTDTAIYLPNFLLFEHHTWEQDALGRF